MDENFTPQNNEPEIPEQPPVQPPVQPPYEQQPVMQPPVPPVMPPMPPMQPQDNKGLAIASMVLGIVALVFSCCLYYIAIPCAVVGIILGVLNLTKHGANRNMAIAGIIMSAVAVVIAIVVIILAAAFMTSFPWQEYLNKTTY